MIVFDLVCSADHRFEGWFGSSADYARQQEMGLVSCPQCGSSEVAKAPMAPAVSAKGNAASTPSAKQPEGAADKDVELSNNPLPPAVEKAFKALAKAQSAALESSTWVGEDFAEKSRAMHYGEASTEPIHGKASAEEAQDLVDEGIEIVPLIVPFVPPEERN